MSPTKHCLPVDPQTGVGFSYMPLSEWDVKKNRREEGDNDSEDHGVDMNR